MRIVNKQKGMRAVDDKGGAAALAIMSGWEWEGWTRFYDQMKYGPITLPLSDAVNKLAFDGYPDAAGAMLSLLASGALAATGDYSWRAYRNGYYQRNGTDHIPARRWQALQEGLALPRGKDWLPPRITFEFLDGFASDTEYSTAEWNWESNRFSTAQPGDEKLLFESSFSEEWFSASNIEILPPSPDNIDSVESAPEPPTTERNRGRPPKWDWEGAIAHVVAVANTPDGLETGPGAQAAIERLIAGWFTRASNDASAPSESEIRKRASRIVKAIENLKTDKAQAA